MAAQSVTLDTTIAHNKKYVFLSIQFAKLGILKENVSLVMQVTLCME